jgi:acyl-CoA synthetase (AMP-forming)/AMP-acid ligase II
MALQAIAPAEGPPEGIHSLADISRVHSRLTPQRPALAFEGRTTTYEQLDTHASQVAHGLVASAGSRAIVSRTLARTRTCTSSCCSALRRRAQ